MKKMKLILPMVLGLLISPLISQAKNFRNVESLHTAYDLKVEIVKIANFFKGQGDKDFRIQNTLVPYVNKLLKLRPQPPIKERLDLLEGRWKQVWGPYEYRKDDRSVDKTLDPDKIFQVVSRDGYYHNVSNNIDPKTGKTKNTGLLRGVYEVKEGNKLDVRFTRLSRIKGLPPVGLRYTDLPELSENGNLEGERKVLPNFIVRWFFSGGTLVESYTDEDLRIAYGTNSKSFSKPYLYVMVRVH